jgi:prepilin-type N-terminal cleavage/methylation domain-containing protein
MFDRVKKDNQGFTIIEVLIVLAIAGLIMIIVFLAVPALQRNQRNQTYRTEANNISTAYQEISANKGGANLTAADETQVLTSSNAKQVTNIDIGTNSEAAPPTTALNDITIRVGAKCTAPDSHTTTTTGASTRQIAILFNIETTGNPQAQCIDS